MIEIKKRTPPDVLIAKQNEARDRNLSPDESYALLDSRAKAIVLKSLSEEQGHLCAYCMRRIPDERDVPESVPRATIEHWNPRNRQDGRNVGQALDYNNLLAVCSGNRGIARGKRVLNRLTCDAKRGSKPLTVNPCNPATLKSVEYKGDGTIFSHDPLIEEDLTHTLNLNCRYDSVQLPNSREKVLNAFLEDMASKVALDDVEAVLQYCRRTLELLEQEKDPKQEYIGIVLYQLKTIIARLESNR